MARTRSQAAAQVQREAVSICKRSRTPEDNHESANEAPAKRRRVSDQSCDEATERASTPSEKRRRISDQPCDDATERGSMTSEREPVHYWDTEEEPWFHEMFKPELEYSLEILARKRERFATPSDQGDRDEKIALYRDMRYEILLSMKGTYLKTCEGGVVDDDRRLCLVLLEDYQPIPKGTIFDEATFRRACRNLQGANEARVIQDIARLMVPSAETLALVDKNLRILKESVNEGWNSSRPLTWVRPQPDYSVGFRREAFTDDQLQKLCPFVGDFLEDETSLFMGTYSMYFPFMASEVVCGNEALDIADRQNAHSMTLAVRGVVDLFRLVRRQDEIDRRVLAFSVSHDHHSVRIYGYYAVIDGPDTEYYRQPIHEHSFRAFDGGERWTAYQFTRNVYEKWAPDHLKMICSAIDQLPLDLTAYLSGAASAHASDAED